MRHALILFTILLASKTYSQTIDVDKNTGPLPSRAFYSTGGFPLSSFKYTKVTSGSAYLSDTWMKGALATADSVQYANVRLKLDLLENSIVYMNEKGEEMVCVTPIIKLTLRDTVSGKTYLFVNATVIPGGGNDKIWYEVLTSGKATLYKQYYKEMTETKAYGSSITEQMIRTTERYFIGVNNSVIRIKKPADMVEQLPAKAQKEVSDYIQKNKLNGKKESDYIAALEYYNSLP